MQVTSLFLHLVPALVSWSLRWHPEDGHFRPNPPAQATHGTTQPPSSSSWGACSANSNDAAAAASAGSASQQQGQQQQQPSVSSEVFSLVAVPMLMYLGWACLYYLQIFVFSAKKIQQRGYQVGGAEGSASRSVPRASLR